MQADGTCRLAVEPWNRYETLLINTLDQAVELVEAVDHLAVCVMGDAFHMGIEENDPIGALRRAAPHLGHLHLADNTRAAPGTGTVDFGPTYAPSSRSTTRARSHSSCSPRRRARSSP